MKPDPRPRVHIQCDRPNLVVGLPVRVLHIDPLREGLVPEDDNPILIDANGGADLHVSPGQYVFEVLGARPDGTVVSVHSTSMSIATNTTVSIPTLPPQPVTLADVNGLTQIDQLALRSTAVRDEARWQRHAADEVPRIVLSPHQTCPANVIASLGKLHVAAWVDVGDNIPPLLHVKQEWNRCTFAVRSTTPPLTSATARIVFPAGEMQIPIEPRQQLVTNRRFMMFGYTVQLKSGQTLTFRPAGRSIGPLEQLQFGGELTPRAWMNFLWPEHEDDSDRQFTWRVDLLDEGGLPADVYPKDAGIRWTLHDVNGTLIRDGLYTKAEVAAIGDVPRNLRCDIAWTWGRHLSRTIQVDAYENVRSEHFLVYAVPAWSWETRNYLTKLERYFRVEQKATGRPGFVTSRVYWRDHTYNAQAVLGNPAGGDPRLWCIFPFRTYEDNHEPFLEPLFVGHEMLHNFGYDHGDAMAKMQGEVEHMFADYRWYMQDHPGETFTVLPATPTDLP